MSVNKNLILYNLVNTLEGNFNVKLCKNFKNLQKEQLDNFNEIEIDQRFYYIRYGLQIAKCLMENYENFSKLELNNDSDHEIKHDFRLVWNDLDKMVHISMDHRSITVRDIIPDKLMKICNYKGNTKICREYKESYAQLNKECYRSIRKKEKYSELTIKRRQKAIIEPFNDLLISTLSKKRKCARHLYSHLFDESERSVLKLYKNRFTLYDFSKDIGEVDSFRMKLTTDNLISIIFNNKAKFQLSLQTNASHIKKHISLKFHTDFKNIDDFFAVANCSV